jgi:RHS repeat-associated protein
MKAKAQNALCRYYYDSLDRLIGTTPEGDAGLKRFYCKSHLATEIQGAVQRSIFQQGEQLLAQQNLQGDLVESALIATDQMRSVLQMVEVFPLPSFAYSPYGHRHPAIGPQSLLGFNGERLDPNTGFYVLGNGYRAFNSMLMRFISPDDLSPFGAGGLNSYVYCLGDPVNRRDESGHVSWSLGMRAFTGFISKKVDRFFRAASTGTNRSVTALANDQRIINHLTGEAAEIIKNTMPPSMIKQEYKEFLSRQNESNEVLIRRITNSADLKLMESGYSYKFVFTDQGQLIVGGRPRTPAGHILDHSVLSHHASTTNVISAGYIQRPSGENFYIVDNYSGHYKPNFESLKYIARHIRGLGQQVKVVHRKKSPL